jgi:flavocytochrome c
MFKLPKYLALVLLLSAVAAYAQFPTEPDADIIVVGAGIAGLSAALEASANGARVVVIEANSVGGGHAVMAGGVSMVDTGLQQNKGIKDSPNLAVRDYFRWGEDADRYWVRQYAQRSAPEVYDWLTEMGVEFRVVVPAPGDSVPRFHFTRGSAVNVVMPLLRKAMFDPNISFVWNTRVTALARARGRIIGVYTRNERDGKKREWRAASTVLSTGGFQNNLQMVRDNWPESKPLPKRMFQGAGHYAVGDGYRLASWAGADMQRMDQQVIFYGGVPDPADRSRQSALYVTNPAALWVGANGRRFMDESADSKVVESAVEQLEPVGYWMIFDSRSARKLNVRDALPAERQNIRDTILSSPTLAKKADSIAALARLAGLPEHGLKTTIETWNRMVEVGTDFQFGRFDPKTKTAAIKPIAKPPFYAVRIFPMTRKNMGGPAINFNAQVINAEGLPIPGLYAAGELTGVAGINGSHGGNGTFLGPSVLTGRIAGKAAALESKAVGASNLYQPFPGIPVSPPTDAPDFGQPGYWHYDAVHRLVAQQAYTCDRCHANANTSRPNDNSEMIARLRTCVGCH